MTEGSGTGYGDALEDGSAPSPENLVDGTPGNDRSDGGEQDTVLLTDDEAQRDDEVTRPGNA
ncbi:hypothetical protein GCU67_04820 [Modestobacter muralis]|uniref:Uncharacterized protein n=1 Tax=Modestobacter muralis TaxID=1608614 RepID=A0A6P0EW53_9ACTN|nr:hypothetical protein [Modestobacter muralis]NEK93498.1 hypothetical protein [Modestobacter muralis]NEN50265.1 hypothetical protein [Modestobacter muralis]